MPGMKPPYLRMLSAASFGIENDRNVEEAEEDDQRDEEQDIERLAVLDRPAASEPALFLTNGVFATVCGKAPESTKRR
jgi:hypothetical protein